jgi:GTPase SAR1 family protein
MMQQLVRDCDGCVFVYDVSNRASFEKLADIHKVVLGVLTVPASRAPKPAIVVANKADLPKTTWVVATVEGNEFAEQIGAKFVETSAKLGSGVNEMAVEIANGVLLGRITSQDQSR